MKNTLVGINGQVEITEEKINEFEGIIIDLIQNKTYRETRTEKGETKA